MRHCQLVSQHRAGVAWRILERFRNGIYHITTSHQTYRTGVNMIFSQNLCRSRTIMRTIPNICRRIVWTSTKAMETRPVHRSPTRSNHRPDFATTHDPNLRRANMPSHRSLRHKQRMVTSVLTTISFELSPVHSHPKATKRTKVQNSAPRKMKTHTHIYPHRPQGQQMQESERLEVRRKEKYNKVITQATSNNLEEDSSP
jgi:hypothetical protein